MERQFHVGGRQPWGGGEVFPCGQGPFMRSVRAARSGDSDAVDSHRQLVVGQWGLVPWFAKTPKLTYSTNNARSEEMAEKATFKHPWARGQRCVIPAVSFDEPNWETGKNIWWRFRRVDSELWGLTGLWNTWTGKATGELVESYTMLTLNADAHPLMRRMHKPDPKLGPDQQDKRSVVAVEPADLAIWLTGTVQEAAALLRLTQVQVFDARAV